MAPPISDGEQRDFLFVQSTTEVGGAESMLLNLFTSSEALRRRSVIASLGFGEGDLPDRLRAIGADVVELPRARMRQPLRTAMMLASLRRLIQSRRVKVVVGNGAHPQVVGGVAARLAGAKSVFLVNMIHADTLRKNHPLDALAIRGPCDLFLAISKASQATLTTLRPGVHCRLLHWGTPVVEVSADDARRARAELGVGAEEVLLGCFGRLQHWKGQDVFVAAAASVARARPQAQFLVVGGSVFGLEPEYFDQLKASASETGVADRIHFTGFRTDVARLMAGCDVVCHTTRVPEPFGLVIVEAMAQGRPVIATRGGGPSEIIANEDEGVLIDPDDPQSLAAAMTALIDDPDRRRRLGDHGQARVRAEFTIETMATALLGHLGSLSRVGLP